MISPINLRAGWWSFALPGFRDHPRPATYTLFAYEDLPPIEAPIDDDFQWLQSEPTHGQWSLADNCYPDGNKADLSRLPQLIADAHITLPLPFTLFMQTTSLHQRIRSCTACMLEVNDYVVRVAKPAQGVLLRFLADQQACLHWYLYATRSGDQCVTVSSELYGLQFEANDRRRDEIDLSREDMWLCAPGFVEFIYRFWLENEIFFTLFDKKERPSPVQRAYLEHYSKLSLRGHDR